MSNIQIAKTIIEQLEQSFDMTINGRKVSIFAYIGAKNLVYGDNMLMFQVPKRQKIIITYNHGRDSYDVDLYSLKTFDYVKRLDDIYFDNLKDVIFSMLGVN